MNANTIAEEILDIQNLVTTGKAVMAEVPGIDVHLVPLEEVLNDTKDITARLQTRKGVKQDESKARRALLRQGHKLAGRVRAALKAHFGLDSERLVEFGARPIRPRKTSSIPAPTTTPTTPGPTPQAPTPVPAAKP